LVKQQQAEASISEKSNGATNPNPARVVGAVSWQSHHGSSIFINRYVVQTLTVTALLMMMMMMMMRLLVQLCAVRAA
jgi:hypothetical protein